MVLFLFGVMLTRARIGRENDLNNKNWALGIPIALTLFAAMAIALVGGFKDEHLPSPSAALRIDTQSVSDTIFKPYLLPFWALSFVLLVAVVGAIVLARKD
jgi:NADH-quinone oxidoreductase subunit J